MIPTKTKRKTFNSTKVQLKEQSHEKRKQHDNAFNSTKVQLKVNGNVSVCISLLAFNSTKVQLKALNMCDYDFRIELSIPLRFN